MGKIQFAKGSNTDLENCILAEVGYAKGHNNKDGQPIYFDEMTLNRLKDIALANGEYLKVTMNHSNYTQDVVGEIDPKTLEVKDSKLIGTLHLLKASFERCTNYVGEFIKSVAEESNTILNMSVEIDGGQEVLNNTAIMRPTNFDCVSIVLDGACTSRLQLFAAEKENGNINNNMDNKGTKIMAEEIKTEVKAAEPVATPAVVPEDKKEEVKAAEPTLADVIAKIDALATLLGSLAPAVEEMRAKMTEVKAEVKATEVAPVPTVEVKASAKREESDVQVFSAKDKKSEALDLDRIKTDREYYQANKSKYFAYLIKESKK